MTRHGERDPAAVTVPFEDMADDPALWAGIYGSMTEFLAREAEEEAREGVR